MLKVGLIYTLGMLYVCLWLGPRTLQIEVQIPCLYLKIGISAFPSAFDTPPIAIGACSIFALLLRIKPTHLHHPLHFPEFGDKLL
jgi:hypothetical protein